MRYRGKIEINELRKEGLNFEPNQVYVIISRKARVVKAVRGRQVLDYVSELESKKITGTIAGPIAKVVQGEKIWD